MRKLWKLQYLEKDALREILIDSPKTVREALDVLITLEVELHVYPVDVCESLDEVNKTYAENEDEA